jgi:putative two-component system response regulator
LHVSASIARHHHERYDGTGYPDGLKGEAIPLPARILAFADVYDALRSRRTYKPSLPHAATLHVMLSGSPGQFDPGLAIAFHRCAPQFDRIFQDVRD